MFILKVHEQMWKLQGYYVFFYIEGYILDRTYDIYLLNDKILKIFVESKSKRNWSLFCYLRDKKQETFTSLYKHYTLDVKSLEYGVILICPLKFINVRLGQFPIASFKWGQ